LVGALLNNFEPGQPRLPGWLGWAAGLSAHHWSPASSRSQLCRWHSASACHCTSMTWKSEVIWRDRSRSRLNCLRSPNRLRASSTTLWSALLIGLTRSLRCLWASRTAAAISALLGAYGAWATLAGASSFRASATLVSKASISRCNRVL